MIAPGSAGRSSAALGIGALAGALASVPAIARVAASDVAAGVTVLALAGGSALVLGPVLALVERARAQGARLSFVVAGLGLALWPIAWFGALLERTTHHRPLGAATFAVGALAVLLGCLLAARRVASLDGTGAGRAATLALYSAAGAGTGLLLLGALRTEVLRSEVLDGLLLVVGGALGWVALRKQATSGALSRVGAALWIALVVGHLFAATRPAFEQIRDRARVLSGPAGWL